MLFILPLYLVLPPNEILVVGLAKIGWECEQISGGLVHTSETGESYLKECS